MKTKILFFITLLSFSQFSLAYQKDIDKFFELYESGKIIEAVDSIYSTNKWISQKPDDIQNVKAQLNYLKSLVGEFYGKVKLGEEHVAERLYHITYLALYERQPVRLEFVFYKPQENWVIYSFSFDDEIDEDLQRFARDKIAGYDIGL